MTRDLASVVIAAYNAEEYIKSSVNSVFNQSYRPLEVVVVNDGSTDSTLVRLQQIDRHKPQDVKMRIIELETNQGAANALNVGFREAGGEFISWLGADDMFIDRTKIEVQINRMKTASAQWSYFSGSFQGPLPTDCSLFQGHYMPYLSHLDKVFERDSQLRFMALLFRNPINGSSVMIRTDCISEYGQFDPVLRNVDADGDLWMRYSILGPKLSVIRGNPIFYRIHSRQTSAKKNEMLWKGEIVRLRLLHAVEKVSKLQALIGRFLPFLVLLIKHGEYLERPLTTEYICEYMLKNWPLGPLKGQLAKLMNNVQRKIESTGVNRTSLGEELDRLSTSNIFKSFEKSVRGTAQ